MSKRTKRRSGTVSILLDVVTAGGLVDLGVELLLGPGVAVLAAVAVFAARRVAPLVSLLHVRAGGGPLGGRGEG